MPKEERVDHDGRRTPPADRVEVVQDHIHTDLAATSPARRRLRITLDLVRSNPTGRIALKIIVAIIGALVVAVGIVLIPLPGPGWLVIFAGLGIWAVEFHWARRLLNFTRRHVHAWTRWVLRLPLLLRFALGAVGSFLIAIVVLLSLKYSLGIDLVASARSHLAPH